jgi:hypothetical protein
VALDLAFWLKSAAKPTLIVSADAQKFALNYQRSLLDTRRNFGVT